MIEIPLNTIWCYGFKFSQADLWNHADDWKSFVDIFLIRLTEIECSSQLTHDINDRYYTATGNNLYPPPPTLTHRTPILPAITFMVTILQLVLRWVFKPFLLFGLFLMYFWSHGHSNFCFLRHSDLSVTYSI